MLGLLLEKVFLEHIDLFVLQHASFSDLAKCLHLCCEVLIFIDFFHVAHVLLSLCGVDGLWPTALLVVHAFLTSTDSEGIHVVL